MIDPKQFGLPDDTVIKFFTPEEAREVPGAKSGYNAVYTISETRTRYELLKAGKALSPVTESPVPTQVPEQVEPQEVVVPVVEEVTEQVLVPEEVEQTDITVEEQVVVEDAPEEVAQPQEAEQVVSETSKPVAVEQQKQTRGRKNKNNG